MPLLSFFVTPAPPAGVPVVMFAGEATHRHYMGTVHGAFMSGYREANRYLSIDSDGYTAHAYVAGASQGRAKLPRRPFPACARMASGRSDRVRLCARARPASFC
mmetsp:Transcript_6033/g.18610  ORF Transcript_6033/g.18610 Transcript_6033/m.18610 type:complete len:104 (+) Transcript_6033:1197-1508(+)